MRVPVVEARRGEGDDATVSFDEVRGGRFGRGMLRFGELSFGARRVASCKYGTSVEK